MAIFGNKKNKEISQEIDLEKFKDLEGVTTKRLEFGLWFVEHRKQMRLAIIVMLILIAAVSWTYTIYGYAYYLVRGMSEDELLISQISQGGTINHNYVAQIAAKDLVAYSAQAIMTSNRKYDLFAQLNNPNAKWWAEFDYYFITDDKQTNKATGYIFPGERKYLMELAQDLPSSPAIVELHLENLRWQRINQHKYPDWEAYYLNHLNIENTAVEYLPAGQNESSQIIGLNQLYFTANNKTPYNYWQVELTILLLSNNNVISINKYTLTDFMSGEKRQIKMSLPGSLGHVDKIEIIPDINIMDPDIYIKYEGGTGEVK